MIQPRKIAHAADLHWFLIKGHEHLEETKNLFIKSLIDEKVELTVLVGDIVDSKNHQSPEQNRKVRELLVCIAEITPIILIPGNHDLDLSSPDREDSLTDTVNIINDLIKPKNKIYYLTNSKVYDLFDINWAHWSVIENQKTPFVENKVLNNKFTIGLFHGPVGTIKLENSIQKVTDVNLDIFDTCDLIFLGDIHLRQSFRNEEIYYPGSWTELSFGEAEIWKNDFKLKESSKGYILWEKSGKTYKPSFKPLNTEYGFKIIQIQNYDTFKMPVNFVSSRKQKVRIDYIGDKKLYSKQKLNEIKKEIQKLTDHKIIFKFDPIQTNNQVYQQVGPIDHLKIFDEYFRLQLNENGNPRFSNEEIDLFKEFDLEINKLIDLNNTFSQGQYLLDELTIHNFISFGSDNHIDFKDKRGSIGILGLNKIGKSSTFEAITFCFFGETVRNAEKAIHLINDQLNEEAFVEIKFWVNGIKYKIKRTIKIDGSTKLDFIEYGTDNTEKSRNSTTRQKTDAEIQKLIGNKKVFLILALSSQKNPYDFVDNGNKDRLEILKQILGIFIYNQKESKGDELRKEKNTLLDSKRKEFEKIGNASLLETQNEEYQIQIHHNILELESLIETIKNAKELVDELNLNKEKIQRSITNKTRPESLINSNLLSNKQKLKLLDELLITNSENYEKSISKLKISNDISIKLDKEALEKYNSSLIENQSKKEQLQKEVLNLVEQGVLENQDINSHVFNTEILYSIKEKIAELNIQIKNETKKLDEENVVCEFCEKVISKVDKEAIQIQINILSESKESLEEEFKDLSSFNGTIELLQKNISLTEKDETYILTQIKNTENVIEKSILQIQVDTNQLLTNFEKQEQKIKKDIEDINLNNKELEKELIDYNNNKIFEDEILVLENRVSEKKILINELSSKEISLNLKINNLENQIERNTVELKKYYILSEEISNLEIQINYLKEYLKSVHRTGIPSLILQTYIPLINYEVNEYLSDVFDIKLEFEMNEGELDVYYSSSNLDLSVKRNISMASGSEGFITNQAIRATLNKISYFVKPDFIMIDEGFGTLDKINIEGIKPLLLKLEKDFENVLVISHEESIKALPQYQVELVQENGVTRII